MTHPIDEDRALFGEEFLEENAMTIAEAIAHITRITPPSAPWNCSDLGGGRGPVRTDTAIAIILNAAASGDLIPKAEIERGLADPTAVHYSMLRGTIAKPSLAQIVHIYAEHQLIPRTDADLAVALAYQRAAAYSDKRQDHDIAAGIRALAPAEPLAEVERWKSALESIASNTCCDGCQEAALVARDALKQKDN